VRLTQGGAHVCVQARGGRAQLRGERRAQPPARALSRQRRSQRLQPRRAALRRQRGQQRGQVGRQAGRHLAAAGVQHDLRRRPGRSANGVAQPPLTADVFAFGARRPCSAATHTASQCSIRGRLSGVHLPGTRGSDLLHCTRACNNIHHWSHTSGCMAGDVECTSGSFSTATQPL